MARPCLVLAIVGTIQGALALVQFGKGGGGGGMPSGVRYRCSILPNGMLRVQPHDERDSFHDSFGAPLPPVEMSIDANRVEVAAGLKDGDCEAWNVVQQLRGSAPYVDLHRDSTMVVHLCSEVIDNDAMFKAVSKRVSSAIEDYMIEMER